MTKSKNTNKEVARMDGHIVRIVKEKGFGFIHANGLDHFFHRSELDFTTKAFEQLQAGDNVSFRPIDGEKGPRATEVRVK
jgi:cold shock CspA family protein